MPETMKTSDKILVGFFASFILAGIVEGLAPVHAEWATAFIMSHILLIAILLFAWCGAHASESHITPPPGGKPLVAFFPPLGVPYYFFARFGLKQGAVKIGKAILFYALCAGVYSGLFYVLQNA